MSSMRDISDPAEVGAIGPGGAWQHPALGVVLLLRRGQSQVLSDEAQVRVEPVEAGVPELPVPVHPVGRLLQRAAFSVLDRHGPERLREISPARSTIFRCRDIAGRLMANGSASSVTVASPSASHEPMSRRASTASAPKIVLS
jgi:hypothetical protein